MNAVLNDKPGAQAPTTYDTHPDRYVHWRLAFDGETARALHDEDLEVDTEFCAMCGHDWCSMRISKEIVAFASGKDPSAQPERAAMRSPGVSDAGRELLRRRAIPTVGDKHACHSELTPDVEVAKGVQRSAEV